MRRRGRVFAAPIAATRLRLDSTRLSTSTRLRVVVQRRGASGAPARFTTASGTVDDARPRAGVPSGCHST
jgi:hypothetical protein